MLPTILRFYIFAELPYQLQSRVMPASALLRGRLCAIAMRPPGQSPGGQGARRVAVRQTAMRPRLETRDGALRGTWRGDYQRCSTRVTRPSKMIVSESPPWMNSSVVKALNQYAVV